MIKPTVGRRVWYWPLDDERAIVSDQPFDAGIAHVIDDNTIRVSIQSDMGNPMQGKQVTLAQDRDPVPGECSWMPYQVGQAKPVHPGPVSMLGAEPVGG